LPSFPFSRLREKVPERADEGVGSARDGSWYEARLMTSAPSTLKDVAKYRRKEHPHPALRATFSRKREKGKSVWLDQEEIFTTQTPIARHDGRSSTCPRPCLGLDRARLPGRA